jgi:hypothetical protein
LEYGRAVSPYHDVIFSESFVIGGKWMYVLYLSVLKSRV